MSIFASWVPLPSSRICFIIVYIFMYENEQRSQLMPLFTLLFFGADKFTIRRHLPGRCFFGSTPIGFVCTHCILAEVVWVERTQQGALREICVKLVQYCVGVLSCCWHVTLRSAQRGRVVKPNPEWDDPLCTCCMYGHTDRSDTNIRCLFCC